jgi:hypothetical protein
MLSIKPKHSLQSCKNNFIIFEIIIFERIYVAGYSSDDAHSASSGSIHNFSHFDRKCKQTLKKKFQLKI